MRQYQGQRAIKFEVRFRLVFQGQLKLNGHDVKMIILILGELCQKSRSSINGY